MSHLRVWCLNAARIEAAGGVWCDSPPLNSLERFHLPPDTSPFLTDSAVHPGVFAEARDPLAMTLLPATVAAGPQQTVTASDTNRDAGVPAPPAGVTDTLPARRTDQGTLCPPHPSAVRFPFPHHVLPLQNASCPTSLPLAAVSRGRWEATSTSRLAPVPLRFL